MRSQFYVPVDGWLNRVDVRVKLFTMIAVIVMCSIWGNWVFLTAMLLAEHLFLLSTRIPARKTLKVWSFFLPVIVIVFCIMLLTVHLPGWTLWRWGSWLVTSGTMDLCAVVALPYRRYACSPCSPCCSPLRVPPGSVVWRDWDCHTRQGPP